MQHIKIRLLSTRTVLFKPYILDDRIAFEKNIFAADLDSFLK